VAHHVANTAVEIPHSHFERPLWIIQPFTHRAAASRRDFPPGWLEHVVSARGVDGGWFGLFAAPLSIRKRVVHTGAQFENLGRAVARDVRRLRPIYSAQER
jgi:hypothetical protein